MKNSRSLGTLFSVLLVFVFAGISFGQVDVPRRTTAITYPLDELVVVQFRGTTRFPRMKGDARLRRTRPPDASRHSPSCSSTTKA